MLVSIAENRIGHLEVSPVSARIDKKLRQEFKEVHGHRIPAKESLLYLQSSQEIQDFLEYVSQRAQADMRGGWAVNARVPDEVIYNLLGLGY
jgi:hypothetical protein